MESEAGTIPQKEKEIKAIRWEVDSMIIVWGGRLRMEGTGSDLIAEATLILRSLYESMCEKAGEEYANNELEHMFQVAPLDDETLKALADETRGMN